MEERPCYVVYAGVNGAGKSTFFRSGLWRTEGIPDFLPRVNPDEIIAAQGLDHASQADQIKAGKLALVAIDEHFSSLRSFNQETTLAGRSALRNIKRAYELGYRVCLFYIGVPDADVALSRIKHRTSLGGHDIKEGDVRRRIDVSMRNFGKALDYCHYAAAYDNTNDFKCLAMWENGTLAWWGGANRYFPWLADAMQSEGWRS